MDRPKPRREKEPGPFVQDFMAQLPGQQPSPRKPITESGEWPDAKKKTRPGFQIPRRDDL